MVAESIFQYPYVQVERDDRPYGEGVPPEHGLWIHERADRDQWNENDYNESGQPTVPAHLMQAPEQKGRKEEGENNNQHGDGPNGQPECPDSRDGGFGAVVQSVM